MLGKIRRKILFNRVTHNYNNVKIAIIFFGLTLVNSDGIKYFQQQTILLEPHSTQALEVVINDSIPENNLLFKVLSKEGVPIFYYREIFTPVCFENKCRPLTVNLYWNITGRYLGFELLDGEFLSKTDHEPFTVQEYEKLNQILANESTPLANMDYNQLTVEPNSHGLGDIDAISSATPQNLTPYVIQGAAYTTYKLWHLIHGITKKEVQNFTIDEISPELIIKILQSANQVDKIWALEHINGYVELTPNLIHRLFELIKGDDYIVAEKALNAINKSQLGSCRVQQLLMQALKEENYNVQTLVIDKMKDCNLLEESITMAMVDNLTVFNGQVFKKVLEVLGKQQLSAEMYVKIAQLLGSRNNYISNSIARFLKNKDVKDPEVIVLLKKYKN